MWLYLFSSASLSAVLGTASYYLMPPFWSAASIAVLAAILLLLMRQSARLKHDLAAKSAALNEALHQDDLAAAADDAGDASGYGGGAQSNEKSGLMARLQLAIEQADKKSPGPHTRQWISPADQAQTSAASEEGAVAKLREELESSNAALAAAEARIAEYEAAEEERRTWRTLPQGHGVDDEAFSAAVAQALR